jgi:prepilin-type N-terminal cleavage/methylation domain-containing protein
MDKLRSQRGFSILEIMIAMAIAVIAISGVILATGGSGGAAGQTVGGDQASVLSGEINAEAVTKAQQLIEQEQALGREDFNLVNPMSSTENVGGLIYTKTVDVVQQPDFLTKLLTATVAWVGAHGQPLSTKISTLVTNLDNVNSPNTCNSTLTNAQGWKNPQHQTWDFDQLGVNTNSGNGFAVSDIQVFNKRIYVTISQTPNTYKDNVLVFDIPNDPSQPPTLRGTFDNDPVSGHDTGPSALAIASTTNKIYAYIASASSFSKGQLQVFDVTNPILTNWIPASTTYKISTTYVPTAGNGSSIFYANGYVFLGLQKTSAGGTEFNMIDVGAGAANPMSPNRIGGFPVANQVNSIYVKNKKAYVASPNSQNLQIIDADPTSGTFMQSLGSYTPPGPAPDTTDGIGSDHGESVWVIGNTAYLGRTYGTKEFYILNAVNPNSGPIGKDIESTNQGSIYGLAIRDYLAFFLTKDQFQVWDISNTGNIVPWTQNGVVADFADANHDLGQFGTGGAGTALDCEGNYVYTALKSTQGNNKDMLAVLYPGVPPFDYSLAASPSNQTIAQTSSYIETITVTQTSGATSQPVSVSLSGFQNHVSITSAVPASGSCTPNPSCTVQFTITAAHNAQTTTKNITVSGTSPSHTNSFMLTVQ